MEGHSGAHDWVFYPPSDDPVASKFGPNAPFWETSLGWTISKYDTTALSYATPHLIRDYYYQMMSILELSMI